MTQLIRVKARWSGFSGGPGYSVLHFLDFGSDQGGGGPVAQEGAQGAATRARTFFAAISQLYPTIVRVDIESEVDVIEDTTGELVNSFAVTPGAQVVGTGTGAFAAASGAVVNWRTAGIRNGRRIRGRTFLVPLAPIVNGTDGNMNPSARTSILQAATALADSTGTPDLVVYARPSSPGAADGQAALVTGVTVPTILAVLRSRRD